MCVVRRFIFSVLMPIFVVVGLITIVVSMLPFSVYQLLRWIACKPIDFDGDWERFIDIFNKMSKTLTLLIKEK